MDSAFIATLRSHVWANRGMRHNFASAVRQSRLPA
jgi:hypothetical protein